MKSFFFISSFFFTFYYGGVLATITIADTGDHYPSEPDRWYSGHFIPGVNYMAHLQIIQDNLDLCPEPSDVLEVKKPSDNFPVVLLVRRNACSDWTKIQAAKKQTYPAGVVRFVIIYDTEEESKDNTIYPEEKKIMEDAIRHYVNYGDDFSMGVLHVSASTGNELLRTVLEESTHTRETGGTRLLLNGESSNNTERQAFLRKALFWFGISFLVSGCCCSFILSVRLQMLNDDDETTVAPPRPTRRRLTFEQVEEWVPEFVYGASNEGNQEEEDGEKKEECCSEPVECTVCLEPFQDGDYMRRLPCKHEFHSYCIAKWLVERSSTCPLCKLDLLPEEAEESDDEQEGENAVSDEVSIVELTEVPEHSNDEQRESLLARLWGRFSSGFQRTTLMDEGGVDTTPLLSNNENSSSNIELERLTDDSNSNSNNSNTDIV